MHPRTIDNVIKPRHQFEITQTGMIVAADAEIAPRLEAVVPGAMQAVKPKTLALSPGPQTNDG